ncbi:hypothetical protein CDAR_570781 [Caerostris darwini]|uniref:Uncharacterized protein n=1 Tax=Caerostris darwini TaxID=1538125 RepID=A0AAV4QGS8_9ARAC|nr:hypothetical protein CDAR_570781 [Caerostris darwini]
MEFALYQKSFIVPCGVNTKGAPTKPEVQLDICHAQPPTPLDEGGESNLSSRLVVSHDGGPKFASRSRWKQNAMLHCFHR